MEWDAACEEAFTASTITTVAYVPDEVTGPLLTRLHEGRDTLMVPVTREEEGVAVLAGAFLGGRRGALIMQASGLGNAINALASLCVACQIPILLVISQRGGLGEFNPAHMPLGRAMGRMLETLGIQTIWLESPATVADQVRRAADLAFAGEVPVAVVLTTALTGGKQLR